MLRKKPPGKVLASAHAVEREFQVLAALKDTPVPVPKALCLCQNPAVIGTPFYIMEHVQVWLSYLLHTACYCTSPVFQQGRAAQCHLCSCASLMLMCKSHASFYVPSDNPGQKSCCCTASPILCHQLLNLHAQRNYASSSSFHSRGAFSLSPRCPS